MAIIATALMLALAACGSSTPRDVTLPAPPGAPSGAARSTSAPPDGRLTLLDGARVRLSAFRGKPRLLWFVADGCASCAASIPVVAQHFAAFARSGTQILVLGMYGAFGSGAAGRAELARFGRAAAGSAFADPTWTWGLASAHLTLAYDSGGVPDEYQLLDPSGQVGRWKPAASPSWPANRSRERVRR
jgi:hypothetical protein